MMHFDAASAECLVLTKKEGLLAAIAHDLKIRVTTFSIEVDEATRRIEARFDARSLRVVTAMQDGVDAPTLSAANKREIEGNIIREVLEARTYPEVRFVSSVVEEANGAYRVTGKLGLHGHQRQIVVRVHREGDRYIGEARIHQPDFGIRPYSAMLGALKVQPDVTVRVAVPAPVTPT